MQNQQLLPCTLISLLSIVAVGCSTEQRTYDISVKNNSSRPITLVLARSDKPDSEIWMTPEQVAHERAPADKQWGLGVVPPGKTASADKVMGTFKNGAQASLRLYTGDLSLGEMLKIPAGSPKRREVMLQNGDNQIVVRDEGDQIHVDRIGD